MMALKAVLEIFVGKTRLGRVHSTDDNARMGYKPYQPLRTQNPIVPNPAGIVP
jgi:hypothetical protein